MIARTLAALAISLGLSSALHAADTPPTPSVSDFFGTWRIAAIVGASEGGVTGSDPKAVLGKRVVWTATDIRSPEGDCRLRQPAVTPMANRTLETGTWGGQPIAELKLSKTDIAKAFGAHQTPVFQDNSGCANGVLIGHEHVVEAFGSGWIYRLDRIETNSH